MILVLEQRGYIERNEDIDSYQVMRKLLQLSTEHELIKGIVEYAQLIIRDLAEKIVMSYSVIVGYRRPILFFASGRILFTFQNPDKKT